MGKCQTASTRLVGLESSPDNLLLQKLLGTVRDYGGRFLEKDDKGEWHETNENRARRKVSQGKSSSKAGWRLSIDQLKLYLSCSRLSISRDPLRDRSVGEQIGIQRKERVLLRRLQRR